MYEVGDLVIYGHMGVCKVENIGVPDLLAVDATKLYYTLSPIYSGGSIYAPVDTATFIRPVMSRDEALSLLDRMPLIDDSVFEVKPGPLLKEHYRSLLLSHDCDDLVHLIKSIHVKRQALAENGKSLGQMEAEYVKRAEELLCDEFSAALGIPRGEVGRYIGQAIARTEHEELQPAFFTTCETA